MMSFEECQEWGKRMRAEKEAFNKKQEEIRMAELKKNGIDPETLNVPEPKWDHPCTPDDGFVTVLYVIGMIASLIFNDFWIAWIVLTAAYGKFITRHDND